MTLPATTATVLAAIAGGQATADDIEWARRRLAILTDYQELAVLELTAAQLAERDQLQAALATTTTTEVLP